MPAAAPPTMTTSRVAMRKKVLGRKFGYRLATSLNSVGS
jgi:hypothetical protein